MIIVKYETEEEANVIITEKESAGYTLVNVNNITEGNFLGFQESRLIPPTNDYPLPLKNEILENIEYLIDLDYRLSLIEMDLS